MKFFKLAAGLIFAVILALVTGALAEKILHLLLPTLSHRVGMVAKVLVIVIVIPLYFYLVESYFIRREKGG